MKSRKRLFQKMMRKCTTIYRWFRRYRRRVQMTEKELGGSIEAC